MSLPEIYLTRLKSEPNVQILQDISFARFHRPKKHIVINQKVQFKHYHAYNMY